MERGRGTVEQMQLEQLQRATPARIGIGHAGPRYTTRAMLDFWAAQATAAASVQKEVPAEVIEALGLLEVRTKCASKYEMLTRPDWGRVIPPEEQDKISRHCRHHVDVQIYFGDGLCSSAIQANLPDLWPALKAGLEAENVTVRTPFFVRYCRVNTVRSVGPLLDAKVTCVLIGERPGLATSESMSAYLARDAGPDMSESDFKVVSNISPIGMPPVEAAAYLVEQILSLLNAG